jgi:hypothetical protein
MIYIRCKASQIDAIIEKAKVKVNIDLKTMNYILNNLDQEICLLEITKQGLAGRKYIPHNHSIINIGDDIGNNKHSKTRCIVAERKLTPEEIQDNKDKKRKKK